MVSGATKIRVRFGEIEVDYEGDEKYLEANLPALITQLSQLQLPAAPAVHAAAEGGSNPASHHGAHHDGRKHHFSVSTICSKSGASTGSDLIRAAAAYLQLTRQQESYTRQQLLDAMKSGTGYYKTSFRDSLTKYLTTLIRAGELMEAGTDRYTLAPATLKSLQDALAK